MQDVHAWPLVPTKRGIPRFLAGPHAFPLDSIVAAHAPATRLTAYKVLSDVEDGLLVDVADPPLVAVCLDGQCPAFVDLFLADRRLSVGCLLPPALARAAATRADAEAISATLSDAPFLLFFRVGFQPVQSRLVSNPLLLFPFRVHHRVVECAIADVEAHAVDSLQVLRFTEQPGACVCGHT